MRKIALALAALVACSSPTAETTTTQLLPSTTSSSLATTTTGPPVECPAAPYELDWLPVNVGAANLDPDAIDPDLWTSVGGTQTTFWGRADGTVAIALIRGALPAVDWPGEKGEVEIDGTPAVVGPHPDGTWVAGWYEEPRERCDLYAMVFYPPVAPSEVESIIEAMNRVGG